MPRIKRFGPLAHGFNRDPEVRELRRNFADWMGYVWLEMCLIADLNGGEIRGTADEIAESLSYISLRKRPSLSAKLIRNALSFMQVCGWIRIETNMVLVLKYLKYHPNESGLAVPTNERTNSTNKHIKNTAPSQNVVKPVDSPFPDDWKWLEVLVKQQNGGFPTDRFLDFQWWDAVSYTCGGLSKEFLEREFASMKRWLMDNPGRQPTPKGYRRFVAGWLERSHDKERRFAYAKK